MIHVGFTGTRAGMTRAQFAHVCDLVTCIDGSDDFVIHHGCCVGADNEFAMQCSEWEMTIVGHPPLIKVFESRRAVELCHGLHKPSPYAVRNQAIVDASSVMIAAPAEAEPQRAGGTWMTIRMALRALRAGKLVALHVIAPDGAELDHSGWSA